MFSTVAPRYDLLNRLLSLGLDQHWRRVAVDAMDIKPQTRALDLCCGTGDLALEIARSAPTVACDFSTAMLQLAHKKAGNQLDLTAGDALSLPYADNSFDAAAIAFGIRNLVDLSAGFSEAYRILRGGSRLVVLEFSRPENRLLDFLHSIYMQVLVPVVGRLLSPSAAAYRYLADTIAEFPEPSAIVATIKEAGFHTVGQRPVSGGIVTIYVADT